MIVTVHIGRQGEGCEPSRRLPHARQIRLQPDGWETRSEFLQWPVALMRS